MPARCKPHCCRVRGKTPHIQNLAVGGVANPINLDAPNVLNLERLIVCKNTLLITWVILLNKFIKWILLFFAAYYPEWLKIGKGANYYLSVPELPINGNNTEFLLSGGYMEGVDFSTYRPIKDWKDQNLKDGIEESGKHAWYEDDEPLKPWEGFNSRPKYTGWDEK